jgi:hypothetical protein
VMRSTNSTHEGGLETVPVAGLNHFVLRIASVSTSSSVSLIFRLDNSTPRGPTRCGLRSLDDSFVLGIGKPQRPRQGEFHGAVSGHVLCCGIADLRADGNADTAAASDF